MYTPKLSFPKHPMPKQPGRSKFAVPSSQPVDLWMHCIRAASNLDEEYHCSCIILDLTTTRGKD